MQDDLFKITSKNEGRWETPLIYTYKGKNYEVALFTDENYFTVPKVYVHVFVGKEPEVEVIFEGVSDKYTFEQAIEEGYLVEACY